ncbi:MAG: bifunctional hydroxymethylpyrimidine kinase/phosphomethylpyrimidine kinase [Acidobacteriia bacterium]|nr:bifunctional hydroxymethylpyrimidine kinase/phosphomethylpyrimidine kinase [Terriglobia bacterium]
MHVALTIAGSDPSGGAGIQADLKTFHQFGVYGEAVITLLTVQNTRRAGRVEVTSAELVTEQLEAVLEDIPPHAAKTGALGSAEVLCAVARLASTFPFPLVVDPVLMGKHGQRLLDGGALSVLRDQLLPCAELVTPNVPEAEVLAGIAIRSPEELREAAERIRAMGARAVLIKGGHREGPATDVLLTAEGWTEFMAARLETRHGHGTGCTYSAAVTAGLACGLTMVDAVAQAKRYLHEALASAPGLGSGSGPVNHWAEAPRESAGSVYCGHILTPRR